MSRKCLTQRNIKKINLFQKHLAARVAIKKRISDKTISSADRFKEVINLSLMTRNASKSRIRNRCAITGRPRAYYRKFGLSRIMLRDLAGKGQIPGLVKSSW